MIVTTSNDVAGRTVADYLGVVRGSWCDRQASRRGFWRTQANHRGNIEQYARVLRSAPGRKRSNA